ALPAPLGLAADRRGWQVGAPLTVSPPPGGEAGGGGGGGGGGAVTPQEPRQTDSRVRRARSLRRAMTDAERKLWWHLRRLPMDDGGHFRRQATIGRYFADFACHQHCLIIEVDGSGHSEDRQLAADAERTAYLNSRGYRVLPVWN